MTTPTTTPLPPANLVSIRRALLSVSDKTDLVAFARALAALDIEIISTGGTARALADAGLPVTGIDEVTGFPEMMDGRVKTLHPAVHGALLGRRDIESHVEAMEARGIEPIDLVCVNLYPFERTIRSEGVTFDEAIEQIDIGGPAILRSASKNHQFVTVLTSPTQYDQVATELRANDGATTLGFRRELATAAFMRTAEYDSAISAWMSARSDPGFPPMLDLRYPWSRDLRYGENPHQKASLYADPTAVGNGLLAARVLHGKPLSYNNIQDAAAALELVRELQTSAGDDAAAAIIKHATPCGAAVASTRAEAFDRAYAGDPVAAYGGILAVGTTVDEASAARMCDGEKFLEVIVAPAFDDAALELITGRWKNVRVLATGEIEPPPRRELEYRTIPGGLLVQERDLSPSNPSEWGHAAGPAPDQAMLRDASFTWTMAKHLKSNAIAIGRDRMLLGGGPGQVDRITACRVAIEKCGDRLDASNPAVAASDAFFPFADGPKLLIDAGIRCLVHPGGSIRDKDTFALCNERGVTCLVTGVRHFRH